MERYFAPGKAALLSVGEKIDTRSAAGRLVLNVLASVTQWDREAIGERTAMAMQHQTPGQEGGAGDGGSARFPNGSVIYLVGADSNEDERQKLLGQKFVLVVIDEAQAFGIDLRQLVYGVLKRPWRTTGEPSS